MEHINDLLNWFHSHPRIETALVSTVGYAFLNDLVAFTRMPAKSIPHFLFVGMRAFVEAVIDAIRKEKSKTSTPKNDLP